ncbi:MAG: hypothetical protein NWE98_06130 [Candidatus Bathyarchaeota archaeon]|nr:hypothetical protein [Candidatus Bathyarchaeota archaeon]
MKRVYVLSLVLIIILLPTTASLVILHQNNKKESSVYVGVAFCGNKTAAQGKELIDRVKGYTNLFILDAGVSPISDNLTASREICDYAVNAGLHLIINLGTWAMHDWPGKIQFLNESKYMYGDKFLGVYYDDEPGGIEIDYDWNTELYHNSSYLFRYANWSLSEIYQKLQITHATGKYPDNYTAEATWFNYMLRYNRGVTSLNQYNLTYLTSDYALYWFDYVGGYQTILAQLGWNSSVDQQIALVRGAATLQNKTWGTIITWRYSQAPYLDSANNIYDQMVTSYNAGAKYIVIFNYPQIGDDPYGGAMTNEHFEALKRFWNNVATKAPPSSPHAEAALVLPKDYGWGMRWEDDRIWGFWGPDDKSPIIWTNLQVLLKRYGSNLDIVYEDSAFPVEQGNYSEVYYWNQTLV